MSNNMVNNHMEVESSNPPLPPKESVAAVDQQIRSGFVRKVYGILSAQLVLTTLIALPIQLNPEWVITHRSVAQIAMFTSIGLVVGVGCCCQEVARKYPQNYVFLLLVTVCESVIVGFISAMYTTQSVVMMMALTAGIFLGLTFYAMTTKTDFTGMGGYLSAGLMCLFLTSFLMIFFPSPMGQKLLAGFGALLFSGYIVYDTQMIMGDKHKLRFGIDDYVFAALNIYLDIINLFLYLLSLFGERR
jgi:FtsH-binding integral membrane protein